MISIFEMMHGRGWPLFALGTCTLAFLGACSSPSPDSQGLRGDISALLAPLQSSSGMPALSAAVWDSHGLRAMGALGVREVGNDTPVTPDDEWHLGSDTKAMTATLIGVYVDRGALHFEDTIGALFANETVDPGYRDVTLEQVLQHVAGVPGDIPADITGEMYADGNAADALSKAVLSTLARPPAGDVGTFVYSNMDYMIAGAVLERATGQTWRQLITAELFDPLDMSSCGFGAPGSVASVVDQPRGHRLEIDGTLTPLQPDDPASDNPPALGPAGVVHCSLKDWGKFLTIHLLGAQNQPNPILSKATMTRLHTPLPGATYADGWGVQDRDWAGGTTLQHSGSNTYWVVDAWIAPDIDRIYVSAMNRGDSVADDTSDQAISVLIGNDGF